MVLITLLIIDKEFLILGISLGISGILLLGLALTASIFLPKSPLTLAEISASYGKRLRTTGLIPLPFAALFVKFKKSQK
jgi:hypothetical protein